MDGKFFSWNSDYSVGVKLLDYDHQEMFATVNELHNAISDGKEEDAIAPIMDRLSRYVMEHFQREEHIMSEYGFPDVADHRRKHHDFARVIYAIRHILANCPQRLSYDRLLKFLEGWLTHHIMGEDMKYKAFMRGGYGKRNTDIVEPITSNKDNEEADARQADKRREHELVAVTVHVPVQSANLIRRCARLLQLGGEKADLLEELTDPIGSISDDEALEIAKAVVQ